MEDRERGLRELHPPDAARLTQRTAIRCNRVVTVARPSPLLSAYPAPARPPKLLGCGEPRRIGTVEFVYRRRRRGSVRRPGRGARFLPPLTRRARRRCVAPAVEAHVIGRRSRVRSTRPTPRSARRSPYPAVPASAYPHWSGAPNPYPVGGPAGPWPYPIYLPARPARRGLAVPVLVAAIVIALLATVGVALGVAVARSSGVQGHGSLGPISAGAAGTRPDASLSSVLNAQSGALIAGDEAGFLAGGRSGGDIGRRGLQTDVRKPPGAARDDVRPVDRDERRRWPGRRGHRCLLLPGVSVRRRVPDRLLRHRRRDNPRSSPTRRPR